MNFQKCVRLPLNWLDYLPKISKSVRRLADSRRQAYTVYANVRNVCGQPLSYRKAQVRPCDPHAASVVRGCERES